MEQKDGGPRDIGDMIQEGILTSMRADDATLEQWLGAYLEERELKVMELAWVERCIDMVQAEQARRAGKEVD